MNTPAAPVATTPDFATVGRAHGLVECAITVSMLEAAGIQVLANSRQTASLAWHWMSALGGIELCVPAHQVETAIDILASFDPAPKPRRGIFGTLAFTIFFLCAYVWCSMPPPASGFYVVRPMLPRASRTGTIKSE